MRNIENTPLIDASRPQSLEITPLEIHPRSEQLHIPNFGLLVISGKPGAGTSSLANKLAELTGTKNALFKAGDAVREVTDTKDRVIGHIPRKQDVDQKIDSRVSAMVYNANAESPAIAEAQIGAITATQAQIKTEADGMNIEGPVYKILIWATKEERLKRLKNAAKNNGQIFTLRKINKLTSDREKKDLEYWKSLYPDVIDSNPLEKGARTKDGKKIYDHEFDTSEMDGDQVVNEVLIHLTRIGLLTPVEFELQPNKTTIVPSQII